MTDKWFIGFTGEHNDMPASDGSVLKRIYSPSKWTSEPRGPFKVTKVLYTYGGGMGGASVNVYVTNFPLSPEDNKFITLTNYKTGKEIILNTRYIVSAEKFEVMVRDIHRSTKHWTTDKFHDHEAHYLIQPNAKVSWEAQGYGVD